MNKDFNANIVIFGIQHTTKISKKKIQGIPELCSR